MKIDCVVRHINDVKDQTWQVDIWQVTDNDLHYLLTVYPQHNPDKSVSLFMFTMFTAHLSYLAVIESAQAAVLYWSYFHTLSDTSCHTALVKTAARTEQHEQHVKLIAFHPGSSLCLAFFHCSRKYEKILMFFFSKTKPMVRLIFFDWYESNVWSDWLSMISVRTKHKENWVCMKESTCSLFVSLF